MGLANVSPRILVPISLMDSLAGFDTYEKYQDDLMPFIARFVGERLEEISAATEIVQLSVI
jgi:hypothetical protein